MARSRFGLESLQAALNTKDTIIAQYQEENKRLRIEVHDLKVEVERLQRRRRNN
nr:MAG TPA: B-ZIP transcription factor [Caudoviricetes sp.]